MRVIAGSLKGRRLASPTWAGLRPTSDKLRETLFNILSPRIVGARVVDAYAGTGAAGIEAISRGALAVCFVEQDPRAQSLIAENLEHCGITTGYTMIRMDAHRAFRSLVGRPGFDGLSDGLFDIVLLDPPYAIDHDSIARVLEAAGEIVVAGGVVVLEHARRILVPDTVGGLRRQRDVRSGDSELSFYGL
jgi:16S rRNA (guanine(966)-N(2))-methyltransferase RsmD